MSTHAIEVVRLGPPEKHPNADRLEVHRIFGYTCCSQSGTHKEGDLVAYVPPDFVVPTDRPEFSWLAKEGRTKERIRVKRLRGTLSMGLLIAAPAGAKEGDNVIAELGIERYELPVKELSPGSPGIPEDEPNGPSAIYAPKYDVEDWHRWPQLLTPGEPVVIREKIHGANARFLWHGGRMWVGSRNQWKLRRDGSPWWEALAWHPEIEALCASQPDVVFYGERYGYVSDLRYGKNKGVSEIVLFDALVGDHWMSEAWREELFERRRIAVPPLIYRGPYVPETVESSAVGPSLVEGASHIREGIVIRPAESRWSDEIGRVQLKCVSAEYLERA